MSRQAGDAAARMRAGAAHVETRDRSAIIGMAEHRARREDLSEIEAPMKYVAADKPEGPFEIERAEDLPCDHRSFEIRRVGIDGGDHEIGDLFAVRVPGFAIRQARGDMLAKEARDMPALRCQRVVERRRNEHFDDRLL